MMPQLETATYLIQYRWTLITLFLLFAFLVVSVLPAIKTNFLIRRSIRTSWVETLQTSNLNKELVSSWSWTKI
uniref:ATP synthase F0 subunit 8 n=1 Tax=Alicia sansibarensis TaxID=1326985 RepID=A0A0U2E1K5_ALISA|nr:ATP synthase F0 subunit 8 [Alicia sansibarensis]AKQ50911.1 ATP synthase F0 subunit 8 [Alicia sansibarensis]